MVSILAISLRFEFIDSFYFIEGKKKTGLFYSPKYFEFLFLYFCVILIHIVATYFLNYYVFYIMWEGTIKFSSLSALRKWRGPHLTRILYNFFM